MLQNIFKGKINSFFFTLFTKITLFVILIILFISILLYYKSETIISGILASSSQQKLAQVSATLEDINSYISRFTIATFYDDSAYSMARLLENPSTDDFVRYNILQNINSSLPTNPFIYSIHMLKIDKGIYFTAGPFPVAYSKYFYDTEILALLKKDYANINLGPIARIMPQNGLKNAEKLNVLSYIYLEKNVRDNSIGNAIVVNVKAESLFASIDSYNSKSFDYPSNIIVIDKNGNIIAHPQQSMFNHNIKNEEFISKTVSSKSLEGSFMSDTKLGSTFVTYSFSETLGWYFITLSPASVVMSAVVSFRTFTIIVCVIILFVGIVVSYLISKKLYSPVIDLKNTMFQLSDINMDTCGNSDEFDVISLIYTKTVESLTNLRKFRLNNLQILKQDFLNDLLQGNIGSYNEIQSKIKDYEVKISIDEKLMVIIFMIDDFQNFCEKFDQNDRNIMLHSVKEISNRFLSRYFNCDTVNTSVDHIIALINISHNENDIMECQQMINSVIKDIQQCIKEHLGLSVTASISPFTSNLEELSEIYAQALENSDYRMIKGYGSIIVPSLINHENEKTYTLPTNKVKSLLEALKLRRYQQCILIYDNIIDHMIDYSPRIIRMTTSLLLSRIYECLTLIDTNISERLSIDFAEFNRKLNNIETIQQINKEFYTLFNIICTREKENSTENIIRKAIEIIKCNYADPQLCAKTISDRLNLSVVYFRKVFRETQGMSVSEYINEFRMEKAKELLETSDINISHILENIGWYNNKYFYTVFKKTYGVTPNEYRLRFVK